MPLTWLDTYKIGNATIDAQHKEVFELANQLAAAQDKAALTLAAMRLYKNTREHFKCEEDLMRQVNYPDIQAHTQRHNALIGRLNAISESIGRDGFIHQDLEGVIADWIMLHVPNDDARLSAFLAH